MPKVASQVEQPMGLKIPSQLRPPILALDIRPMYRKLVQACAHLYRVDGNP